MNTANVNNDCATVIPFHRKPEVQLVNGERPRVTDDAFDVIMKCKDLYNYGSKLSYVDGDKVVETCPEFISDYLGRRINFYTMRPAKGGDFERLNTDAPEWLSKRIIKLSGQKIPELISIITAPTLRPDGSVLSKPGYDPETKLLLLPGNYPEIPEKPTMDDVKAAFKVLWFPFSQFPYISDNDRGTALACGLTAPVRKTLSKAPGFNFDAPMSSSGKTLLASISQELIGRSYVYAYSNDTELKKTITAILRDGYDSLLLDNIRGRLDSPAMEALLTSETWGDRVLKESKMFSGPSRMLVLFSGNNFQPGEDLWRRVLNCRIDPEHDNPDGRAFDFNPVTHARKHRQEMIAAALTILSGFLFRHRSSKKASDALGSFEDWDRLVRQCVIWLGEEKIAPVADPKATMKRAKDNDPARQRLSIFLRAVRSATCGKPFTTNELIETGEMINGETGKLVYPTINNILLEVATHRSSNCFNSRVLGSWIGKRLNNRCDGLWLERGAYSVEGLQQWVVRTPRDGEENETL
jgi:hypothetical protein